MNYQKRKKLAVKVPANVKDQTGRPVTNVLKLHVEAIANVIGRPFLFVGRKTKQAGKVAVKVAGHKTTKEVARQLAIITASALISRAVHSKRAQYIIIKQANDVSKT